jgi:diguanylate cyclase (GGDEF)-like protein/PAS domain S-box-containing protein
METGFAAVALCRGSLPFRRRTVALIVAAVVVVAVVHVLRPTGAVGEATFLIAGSGAAAAAWIGARRSPRSAQPIPQLVAAGISASALGDLIFYAYGWMGIAADVSLADIAWFSSYVALGAGLLIAIARGRGGAELTHVLLDVVAMSCVSVLVMWDLSVMPIMADSSVSSWTRIVWAGYPTADAILFAIVLRALATRRSRRTVGVAFAAGVACWLAADFVFLVLAVSSTASVWLDVGWIAGAWLLAVPTFRTAQPLPVVPEDEPSLGYGSIAFALLPLLVPSLIEVAGYLRDVDANPIPLLVATVLLVGLVFARTSVLLRGERRARLEAKASRRHYEQLAANSSDAVIIVDSTGHMMNDSPQLAALLGYPGVPTKGLHSLLLVADGNREVILGTLERARQCPGEIIDTEISVVHSDDTLMTLGARVLNLIADDDVGGILINLHDITDRKRAEVELSHQAFHDSLTGLANRALFRDRLTHALGRNARTGFALSVLYLDLDEFKTVNDSLGHDAGDDLLKEVSGRLVGAVRPGDTVARLGGDEFAILIEASDHASDEATNIADRILQALSEPIEVSGQRIVISASIGITTGNAEGTAATLLRDADIAMYRAKASGKAHWVSYEPHMRAAAIERTQLETDLRNALGAGQFRLVYQPVVKLETQQTVGFEALLRWDHPTLGVVGPDKFIPIAEQTGLIVTIGEWVLQTACGTAARWQEDYPEVAGLTMAVNLSTRQLEAPELLAHVADALAASGLEPAALVLEITESALIADPVVAAQRLRQLRSTGVRLAIDDFGTGYSSLSYLRQFPVDILKIDQSFVSSITDRTGIPPIVRGLLDLARTLELEIIAEGVEHDAQRDGLRAEQCEFAQGYLFARPLDIDDAELLLVHATATARATTTGIRSTPR